MSLSDRPLSFEGGSNLGVRASSDFDMVLLTQIMSRLSIAAPIQGKLEDVVHFVTTVVKCDSCLIYVLEQDELVLRASKNPRPEVVDRLKMKMGEGITGWVAQNREAVVITERAYEDFRFRLFNDLPEDRFEAFLSVPVVSGGRLVGVINIQNRTERQYSDREIKLVETIGCLVGAEIERTRLANENSQLLEKLETRTLVERAKRILQRDLKVREGDAYRTMQRESQQRRRSMGQIAQAIILGDEVRHPSK